MTIGPREGHALGATGEALWVTVRPLSSPLHPMKTTLHLQINRGNDFSSFMNTHNPSSTSLLITTDIHPQTAATDTITRSNYC